MVASIRTMVCHYWTIGGKYKNYGLPLLDHEQLEYSYLEYDNFDN